MVERYVTRLMGIPTYTQEQLETDFNANNVHYKHLYFATQDKVHSAGYAFVEFDNEEQQTLFLAVYPINSLGDAMFVQVK